MIKFTIELESYDEPNTVIEEKITYLSKAFLTSFQKLGEDYRRFAGELKFNMAKMGMEKEPSKEDWLEKANKDFKLNKKPSQL